MEATEIEYDSRRRNPSLRTAPSGPRYFLAVSVNEPNPATMRFESILSAYRKRDAKTFINKDATTFNNEVARYRDKVGTLGVD